MQRPLGAQISHMLKSRGVDTIFGIPGVHNQEMYRGIEEAGLRHVLGRHEQGVGFMADGYARATGKPGVCYVITGPGLCNIMTPMGQAYSDRVPLLVISSCLDETAKRRGQLHQMRDQRGAAETVSDWSQIALTAEAAYGLIDLALAEFDAGQTRPKHIQVPIKVLEALADPAPERASMRTTSHPEFDRMLRPILQAKKPVFVFGGGARRAYRKARAVTEKLGAASFMTYAGRGICDPQDPLTFGSMLGRPESANILKEADIVVAVGTEISEVDLWRDELGHEGAFIRIDHDASVMATGPKGIHLVADAEAALDRLLSLADGMTPSSDWQADEVARIRKRWRAEIDAERPGIMPVANALKGAIPKNTQIFSDMTQFAYAAKEFWDLPAPGLWHHPYGFGTLGYALPAGIGGALGRKGSPTMVIIGDYGFQYTLPELGAAVELGLSLPVMIWDNDKLGEIEDSMVRAQIAPNAVDLKNPDFVKLAAAYECEGVKPSNLQELCQEVLAAFDRKGPTLIHVRSDIAVG